MKVLVIFWMLAAACSLEIEKDGLNVIQEEFDNESNNNQDPNSNPNLNPNPSDLLVDPHTVSCQTRGNSVVSNPSNTITLSPNDNIKERIENSSYSIFLLEDGVYSIDRTNGWLLINRPNITIKSVSGNRDNVIIDSNYSDFSQPSWRVAMISIEANNVTIADITLRRAFSHLIHIKGASSIKISNVKFLDSSEQFLKANLKDDNGSVCVEVSNSSFELTSVGRTNVQDAYADGCYTGGIDTHVGLNWWVHDNYFEGIYCNRLPSDTLGRLAEHAIHFWHDSENTIIERNFIKNCARGIGFGLDNSGTIGGAIRNNIIFGETYLGGGYWDTGISIWHALNVMVNSNVVYVNPSLNAYFGIEYRYSDTSGEIRNNISSKGINQRGSVPNVVVSGNTSGSLQEVEAAINDWNEKHLP